MNDILYAFYMTMELWIFVGILLMALVIEEGIKWVRNRDEELQKRIDAEIDRLHQ